MLPGTMKSLAAFSAVFVLFLGFMLLGLSGIIESKSCQYPNKVRLAMSFLFFCVARRDNVEPIDHPNK